MGEAKRRGTREERVAQAVRRKEDEGLARARAEQGYYRPRGKLVLPIAMASVAMGVFRWDGHQPQPPTYRGGRGPI